MTRDVGSSRWEARWIALVLAVLLISTVVLPVTPVAGSELGEGSISGTVTDETGTPLDDICVTTSRIGDARGERVRTEAGVYTARGLASGYYNVRAGECEFGGTYQEGAYGGEFAGRRIVEVVEGDAVDGIDIVLESAVGSTPGAVITGTVRLPADDAVFGMSVYAIAVDQERQQRLFFASSQAAAFGAETRDYEIAVPDDEGLEFYVLAFGGSDSPYVSLYDGGGLDSSTLSLDDAAVVTAGMSGVDLQLGLGNPIRGRMTTSTAEPLTGMCWRLRIDDFQDTFLNGQVDDDGRFLAAGLDGDHDVSLAPCRPWDDDRRLIERTEAVTLPLTGAAQDRDYALQTGAVVTGRVTGPDGEPLLQSFVSISRSDGEGIGRGTSTNADGLFRLPVLPVGSYQVDYRAGNQRFGLYIGSRIEVVIGTGDLGTDVERDASLAIGSGFRFFEPEFFNTDGRRCLSRFAPTGGSTEPGTRFSIDQLHTGDVLAAGVVPGTYDIEVGCDETLVYRAVTLATGEVVDLSERTPDAREPRDEQPGTPDPTEPELPAPGGFGDVSADSVHAGNIERLVAAGITQGCADGQFCPQDLVTRDQMATFLTRALDLVPAGDLAFSDVVEGSTHDLSIRAMTAAQITAGCAEGLFCPRDSVTRGQMATFLTRALALEAPDDPLQFDDVAENDVHRENIEALAEAEITLGCTEGRFCPGDAVTREQMATFLVRALDL